MENRDAASRLQKLDADFVEVERTYIRQRVYPDFDWVSFSSPSPVNPLARSLSDSRVALVTTCGIHLKSDPRFNLSSRIGDPSYREIPNTVDMEDLMLSHVGYNIQEVSADKNCVFPLDRLRELEADGLLGALAPRHFSFMGYVAVTEPLVKTTAPEVAQKLKEDQVDWVLLVPA